MTAKPPATIDEYIAGFPPEIQRLLETVRETIRKTAPGAEEKISYQIPAFRYEGQYLIYFAAHKKHIGLYPVPENEFFEKDFAPYKTSGKGTIQFPFDKPLPLDLIAKIVKFRIAQNRERAEKKTPKT
ncbi:MAG TPA: DUF1801 domain-containing protein [Saprospiraceae bacterium]|nr:DUF1801 domain-containing protein [Saprospiraceae bacterium]